jgi:hypothetical protein
VSALSRFVGCADRVCRSIARRRQQHLAGKKNGVLIEHPLKPCGRNYRFFAAFFFAPLAAFFAIGFSPQD